MNKTDKALVLRHLVNRLEEIVSTKMKVWIDKHPEPKLLDIPPSVKVLDVLEKIAETPKGIKELITYVKNNRANHNPSCYNGGAMINLPSMEYLCEMFPDIKKMYCEQESLRNKNINENSRNRKKYNLSRDVYHSSLTNKKQQIIDEFIFRGYENPNIIKLLEKFAKE